MNSMLRFNIFCRLRTISSDWLANEYECNDSEGNRAKSSQEPNVDELDGSESELTRADESDVDGERDGIINP
jgi:hypothetical protein